jgi:hypothetical protein
MRFQVSINNFGECVLGASDIGWSTTVEAKTEAEAFQLGLAEAVTLSASEGLPPHGIKRSISDIRRLLFVRPCPANAALHSGAFFRIMVPPADRSGFMVGEYRTRDHQSYIRMVRNSDGVVFFPSIEDARNAMPPGAKQLPFKTEYQFIELWELPDDPA